VLTEEGHLEAAVEVGPLVAEVAANDVHAVLEKIEMTTVFIEYNAHTSIVHT
jgi:hypothetical protein